MGELCGSREGWTRLAYKDMSDPSEECPDGFRLYQSENVRACGRPVTTSGSCALVKFDSLYNNYYLFSDTWKSYWISILQLMVYAY